LAKIIPEAELISSRRHALPNKMAAIIDGARRCFGGIGMQAVNDALAQ
jgi:hypothetical protein